MIMADPTLSISSTGSPIPQLAFGMYKVPANEEGEAIILDAVKAGYRHFDTASYYGNEETLGKALKRSGIPRDQFFIVSKVWNDAQKLGRAAVRHSVERSIADLNFGTYYDLFLIHWPVPNYFVETYRELESLQGEKKIRHIGLSNFSPAEYEELISNNITVPPVVNQFEVSPLMYRPRDVEYFQYKGVLVSSSKALHRGKGFDHWIIEIISKRHNITAAQVVLRWGVQKGLIVVAKTSNFDRMVENRDILHFSLGQDEMAKLDSITTEKDVSDRETLEKERKTQM
ncbi:aldo-keto reductase family protein [Skeletonema marinoi]|uniref:Aldo-keto reductase family protein n=1 Tax=Skeletonema marinoi TaxID=267567 RepID=A0AAD8Y6E8_9STRA|nr:aldo-keto reductase family protein [Skeletonema marinoi]